MSEGVGGHGVPSLAAWEQVSEELKQDGIDITQTGHDPFQAALVEKLLSNAERKLAGTFGEGE